MVTDQPYGVRHNLNDDEDVHKRLGEADVKNHVLFYKRMKEL